MVISSVKELSEESESELSEVLSEKTITVMDDTESELELELELELESDQVELSEDSSLSVKSVISDPVLVWLLPSELSDLSLIS